MVEQPPGRRRDHVHAARQIVALFSVSNSSIHDRHREVGVFGVFLKRLFHLQRQLARRLEHQTPRFLLVRAEPVHQRQRKRRRLARPRLRRTDHVLPGQNHRNRLRLDRRRFVVAHLGHRKRDRVAQPEFREGCVLLGNIHVHHRLDRRARRTVKRLVDHRTLAFLRVFRAGRMIGARRPLLSRTIAARAAVARRFRLRGLAGFRPRTPLARRLFGSSRLRGFGFDVVSGVAALEFRAGLGRRGERGAQLRDDLA